MSVAVETPPVLEAVNVSKWFGPTQSLDGVSMAARAGRIVALVGDNGAGKSTLVKILSGVMQPDRGTLRSNGKNCRFRSPADARRRGVATVFQDLAVCPVLTLTRNIVLGNEPTKGVGPFRWYDHKSAEKSARDALSQLGVRITRDVNELAARLSGGERQALAIARAVYYGSACLILDEPTAALAVRQAGMVREHIMAVRHAGHAVILITHNMREALEFSDEVVALNHGRVVGVFDPTELTLDRLNELVSLGR